MNRILRFAVVCFAVILSITACNTVQKTAQLPEGNKLPFRTNASFAQPTGRFNTSGGYGLATPSAPKAAEQPVKKVVVVDDEQTDDALYVEKATPAKNATSTKKLASKKSSRKAVVEYSDTDAIATTDQEYAPVKPIKSKSKNRKESVDITDAQVSDASTNAKFHVVVGSFSSKANADAFFATLGDEGAKGAKIAVNEQGLYRVVIASFNDYEQARSKASSVASKYADAWVLIQGKSGSSTYKTRIHTSRAASMGS